MMKARVQITAPVNGVRHLLPRQATFKNKVLWSFLLHHAIYIYSLRKRCKSLDLTQVYTDTVLSSATFGMLACGKHWLKLEVLFQQGYFELAHSWCNSIYRMTWRAGDRV